VILARAGRKVNRGSKGGGKNNCRVTIYSLFIFSWQMVVAPVRDVEKTPVLRK